MLLRPTLHTEGSPCALALPSRVLWRPAVGLASLPGVSGLSRVVKLHVYERAFVDISYTSTLSEYFVGLIKSFILPSLKLYVCLPTQKYSCVCLHLVSLFAFPFASAAVRCLPQPPVRLCIPSLVLLLCFFRPFLASLLRCSMSNFLCSVVFVASHLSCHALCVRSCFLKFPTFSSSR